MGTKSVHLGLHAIGTKLAALSQTLIGNLMQPSSGIILMVVGIIGRMLMQLKTPLELALEELEDKYKARLLSYPEFREMEQELMERYYVATNK